jgi:O-antigen/teichoic acid export membrane protein
VNDPGSPPVDPELTLLEPEAAAPDALDGSRTAGLLVRGGVLRLVSYAATVLLSVISASALTRHLGAVRFGEYATILSVVTVVSTVTDSGMSNIGTREYAAMRGEERNRLLAALLGLRLALSLAGVLIVVAFALANGYGTALLLGGIGAALATIALVVQHTFSIPLSADLRLGAVSALEFGRQALLTGGIVALVLIRAGVFPLLSMTLAANAALIVPTWMLARGQISLRPSVRIHEWLALLRPTIVFSLASAVGTIYVYTAQILTSYVTTGYQRGLFAFSFRIFVVAGSVPGLVVSTALPVLSRAARDDRDRLAYVMQRIFQASLITGLGSAIVLSAGARFVMTTITGSAAATGVLEIQAWALIASFVLAIWSFGLLSLHLHRGIMIANLASLVVSVILTILLGRSDGARGAAIATIAGETTLAVVSFVALTAGRPQYRPDLRFLPRVALAGCLAGAAAFGLDLPSLVRALLAALVYLGAILILRTLPPEFRQLLPPRWR